MADRLRHLLLMSARSNVTIQVMPFTAGAISNMSGPFTILEFDDEIDKHTVYLESAAGGDLVDNEEDVEAFVATFADSKAKAMSVEDTTELIQAALDKLEN